MRYKFDSKIHAHTLDGQPLIGTSGVGNVLAKPLTWWASGLAVKELGIPDPKVLTKIKNRTATQKEIEECMSSVLKKRLEIVGMTDQEFFKLLDKAYRAHQNTLVEKGHEGTDLHAELERFIKDQIEEIEFPIKKYSSRIQPFIDWYHLNVAKILWSEMNCYSEVHWLGGISDFGFVDKQGRCAIMDFKSSKEAYLSQFWQCAGYDIEITENGGYNHIGTKIFDLPQPIDYYAVLPFGAEKPTPVLEFDVKGSKEAFLAMLLLYKKLPKQ